MNKIDDGRRTSFPWVIWGAVVLILVSAVGGALLSTSFVRDSRAEPATVFVDGVDIFGVSANQSGFSSGGFETPFSLDVGDAVTGHEVVGVVVTPSLRVGDELFSGEEFLFLRPEVLEGTVVDGGLVVTCELR